MSKLIGNITKAIFKSENNYSVLLFKVRENDIDEKYNGKTVTITGYFYDIEENFDLSLIGEFSNHSKYGEQFNVSSYTNVIPDDKNSIVTFLSSDLFKGIGTSKALKIYEKLGDNCINIIKEDSSCLIGIPALSDKNIEVIVNRLNELDQSTDTIILLTDLGFNIKDATVIYNGSYLGSYTSSDLNPYKDGVKDGSMRLIDKNYDSRYDMIIINAYDIYVVSSMGSTKIFNVYKPGEVIDLADYEERNIDISNVYGDPIAPSSIKKGLLIFTPCIFILLFLFIIPSFITLHNK